MTMPPMGREQHGDPSLVARWRAYLGETLGLEPRRGEGVPKREGESSGGAEGSYRKAPYSVARLVYRGGASKLTLRGEEEMSELYRARFEGVEPAIAERDGVVSVKTPKVWPWRWHEVSGEIDLAARLPWEIEFRGGLSKLRAQLGGVALRAFDVGGGASDVALDFGRPRGTCTVRISGGVSDFSLVRPVGVGVRVRIHGGASDLTLDEFHFGAVGGQLRWESHGFPSSEDRFDVEISGGASDVRIGVSARSS